jgi:hypothetical protein
MRELGVSVDDVLQAVRPGEVIEVYPERNGQLVLGWVGARPLHVPMVHDGKQAVALVVTVCVPDAQMRDHYRVRRR